MSAATRSGRIGGESVGKLLCMIAGEIVGMIVGKFAAMTAGMRDRKPDPGC